MLFKLNLLWLLNLWTKAYGVTIQMKAAEQYLPVVLFIMLYRVVLTFESVDEILKCYHSNETSLAELLHGSIYFLGFTKGNLNFWEFLFFSH